MGNLAVRRLPPRHELSEYVKHIWVFESSGGLSEEETQIIVPNGSAKMMLYYKGRFTGRVGDRAFSVPDHKLFVLGVSDRPTIAEFDRNQAFGCICVEFHPAFAYRMLAVPQHELRNTLVHFGDLIAPAASRIMEERMYMTPDPAHKAMLLQDDLAAALALTERDAKFEYGVSAIWNSRGRMLITELSQDMGHGDRWLRAKFAERLGIGPKTFASIVRFQSCFQALLRDKRSFLENGHYYDFYYDQAHFIKEFKRFMGLPPAKYAALQNEVGEIAYFDDVK